MVDRSTRQGHRPGATHEPYHLGAPAVGGGGETTADAIGTTAAGDHAVR